MGWVDCCLITNSGMFLSYMLCLWQAITLTVKHFRLIDVHVLTLEASLGGSMCSLNMLKCGSYLNRFAHMLWYAQFKRYENSGWGY